MKRDYKKLKRLITELLEKQNVYNEIDSTFIDGLITNVELADIAWQDVKDRGLLVEGIRSREKVQIINPSVAVHQGAHKNIAILASKLSLTTENRIKLKLNEEPEDLAPWERDD